MTDIALDLTCARVMPFPGADVAPFSEMRILLVEDDPAVQELFRDYFTDHGFHVVPATSYAGASALLASGVFDIVVLDLRLGGENGLDLLRELRTKSDTPVIITTGQRLDEIDRVVGLELGADDYIIKPFGLRELLARVRVILRRAEAGTSLSARAKPPRYSRFGGWTLDRRARRVTDPTGKIISITKGEYSLLLALVDAAQRPLSREQLLHATRMHEDVFDRSIDVQILRLRRKLEADPSNPQMILTERGVGYVFAVPVDTTA